MKSLNFYVLVLFLLANVILANVSFGFMSTVEHASISSPKETPTPTLTASPNPIILKVGDDATEVKFKLSDETNAADVHCTPAESTKSIVKIASVSAPQTMITLKAAKATNDAITIPCDNSNGKVEVVVTKIKPEVENATLTIADLSTTSPLKNVKLVEGQTLIIKVDPTVTLDELDNAFLSLKFVDGAYRLTGKGKSDVDVKLLAKSSGINIPINGGRADDGIPVAVAGISVQPVLDITRGGQVTIEGDGKTVSFDPSNFVPTVHLTYRSNRTDFAINGSQITALPTVTSTEATTSQLRPQVTISSDHGTYASDQTKNNFVVNLVTTAHKIQITPLSDPAVYLNGGNLLLNAQVYGDDGRPASPQPTVNWKIADADKQFINVPGSGGTIFVTALKTPTDTDKTIKITASVDGFADTINDFVSIFVRGKRNVVDFKPVKVRIDMLDQRTAADLFGRVASNDYHISKIRIVNDLASNIGGGAASSIIFFSDALEVRVELEKKLAKGGDWAKLTSNDIYYINNWTDCNEEEAKIKANEDTDAGNLGCDLIAKEQNSECELEAADPSKASNDRLCKAKTETDRFVCQRKVKFEVAKGSCGDDIDCVNHFNFCKLNSKNVSNDPDQAPRNAQWIPFRPFVYQVVANTHDARDARSIRSMIFLGANIAGSGLSFLTSILKVPQRTNLPAGLDKYQNLLLPAMAKLFPSLSEVQRQNIVSDVLPPLVEVPFGQDVSKYVFFPKKQIAGILPGHYVRIVSISSYNISVRVGIVQKGNIQQVP